MGNVTIGHVIDLVIEQLQDSGYENWSEQALVNWANLGCRQIVAFVPEANAVIESVKLAQGIRQQIGGSGLAVLQVTRNMGTDGKTPGPAIRRTSVEYLTLYDSTWTEATADNVITDVAIDHMHPTQFFVYPPADGTTYVEVIRSEVPPSIVWDSGGAWRSVAVGISNAYIGALVDYILSRAYGQDSDFPGNEARKGDHYRQFLQEVGVGATTTSQAQQGG